MCAKQASKLQKRRLLLSLHSSGLGRNFCQIPKFSFETLFPCRQEPSVSLSIGARAISWRHVYPVYSLLWLTMLFPFLAHSGAQKCLHLPKPSTFPHFLVGTYESNPRFIVFLASLLWPLRFYDRLLLHLGYNLGTV